MNKKTQIRYEALKNKLVELEKKLSMVATEIKSIEQGAEDAPKKKWEIIVDTIRANPGISAGELQSILGYSVPGHMNLLIDRGVIRRELVSKKFRYYAI